MDKRHGIVVLSISTIFVFLLGMVPLSAYAGPGPAPEFAMKCYTANTVEMGVFPPIVRVEDQFQNNLVEPDRFQRLCVEGLKHSSQPPAITRYWIEYEDEAVSNVNDMLLNPTGITIIDQFLGMFTTNFSHLEILVPANVTDATGQQVNTGALNNQQHYNGYSFGPTIPPGTGNSTVQYTDIFGTSFITIKHEDTFVFQASAIKNGTGTLLGQDLDCYFLDPVNEKPQPIDPTGTAKWTNQFETLTVNDLGPAEIFCVIAQKITPTPRVSAIGGDIIPLDAMMVLAAGTQYTAAWMIPVIVSAIGIGIVIARKF